MPISEVQLHLTPQEAAAAMLLISLGTDAYEGKEPDIEAVDHLNRIPTIHLRGLHRKLDAIAERIEAATRIEGNGL